MFQRVTFSFPRAGEPRSAFDRSRSERALRVLVDADSLPAGEPLDHLLGFAFEPDLEVTSLSSDTPRFVMFGDVLEEEDMRLFDVTTPEWGSQMAIWPHSQWRRKAAEAARSGLVSNETAALADLEILALAQELRVDCFATGRNYEWVGPRDIAVGNVMSTEDALALIGLFLRSRSNYTLWKDQVTSCHGATSSIFHSGMRAALPASWDWFAACLGRSRATGDELPESYGAGALRRFERALVARDHLQLHAHRDQSSETIAEIQFYLDVTLVMLAAVFDAVARVVHLACELSGSITTANWRTDAWRVQLAFARPDLAAFVADSSEALATIQLVAALRNNIHGEDFASVLVSPPTSQRESLVRVPSSSEARVRSLMAVLGGEQPWGSREVEGGLWLQPDLFVEELVPRVASIVDELMTRSDLPSLWPIGGFHRPDPLAEHEVLNRAVVRLLGL